MTKGGQAQRRPGSKHDCMDVVQFTSLRKHGSRQFHYVYVNKLGSYLHL